MVLEYWWGLGPIPNINILIIKKWKKIPELLKKKKCVFMFKIKQYINH
jgi:hypothetical protein